MNARQPGSSRQLGSHKRPSPYEANSVKWDFCGVGSTGTGRVAAQFIRHDDSLQGLVSGVLSAIVNAPRETRTEDESACHRLWRWFDARDEGDPLVNQHNAAAFRFGMSAIQREKRANGIVCEAETDV